ncbi:hypothetical protein KKA14_01210, partial [bacterium]|nr:hypothetical protein [bacterium]
MNFCQFIENIDVHVIDYSGKIDFKEGLSRIELLENYLKPYISRVAPLKLLIDFRNTEWESLEVHDLLSKAARQKFGTEPKNSNRYTAILNNQYSCPSFKNEHWFTNKEEAINWLSQQK